MANNNNNNNSNSLVATANGIDDRELEMIADNALSKDIIRKSNVAIYQDQSLKYKSTNEGNKTDTPSTTDQSPSFMSTTVKPIFVKDGKPTGIGYGAIGATTAFALVQYMKHRKNKKWSEQTVRSGIAVVPLVYNTDSSHIKGMLNV